MSRNTQPKRLPTQVKTLTRKEKAFADHIINNPKDSNTEAAAQTYDASTRDVARQIASENLAKPHIRSYPII